MLHKHRGFCPFCSQIQLSQEPYRVLGTYQALHTCLNEQLTASQVSRDCFLKVVIFKKPIKKQLSRKENITEFE